MTRRLTPLLAGCCVLLALLLAALWFAPGPVARWRAWHAPAPQPPNLDDVQAAFLTANTAASADYPEVLARPLLAPTRRPGADDSDAVTAPPLAIEQVKFTGIVAGPTLTGVMLTNDQDQSRFVRQGEAVGDWTLVAIDGRTLTFRRRGQSKQIDLPYANLSDGKGGKDNKNAAPAAPGAPPAAAPPPAPKAAPEPAPEPAPAPAPAASAHASAPPAATPAAPAPQAKPTPTPTPSGSPTPGTTSLGGGTTSLGGGTTSLGGGTTSLGGGTTSLGGGASPARPPTKGGKP